MSLKQEEPINCRAKIQTNILVKIGPQDCNVKDEVRKNKNALLIQEEEF